MMKCESPVGATVSAALRLSAPALLIAITVCTPAAQAGEISHYLPGVLGIRDYALPPKGVYYAQYNVYYGSNTLKNGAGDTIDTIRIRDREIKLDVNVDVFTVVPTLIWSTGLHFLGADYAALISPTFGNASVGAELSTARFGREADESQFNVGDLMVAPVMLGWHRTHWDATAAYSFYAPTGAFDAGAADNVGLGFWSHLFQGAGYYYPFENKATALELLTTYEINSNQEGDDIRPGDHFSFEWGISQYLSEWLEVGISGSHLWQTTKDTGADARNRDTLDRVHAAGFQIGVWPIKQKLYIGIRNMWEYAAQDRFEGVLVALNGTYIF